MTGQISEVEFWEGHGVYPKLAITNPASCHPLLCEALAFSPGHYQGTEEGPSWSVG